MPVSAKTFHTSLKIFWISPFRTNLAPFTYPALHKVQRLNKFTKFNRSPELQKWAEKLLWKDARDSSKTAGTVGSWPSYLACVAGFAIADWVEDNWCRETEKRQEVSKSDLYKCKANTGAYFNIDITFLLFKAKPNLWMSTSWDLSKLGLWRYIAHALKRDYLFNLPC